MFKRGNQLVRDFLRGGDMHRRRKRVVGGLAEIDMIVWVHRPLRPPHAAQDLARPIGDHLV
jgi:hypothetical protein